MNNENNLKTIFTKENTSHPRVGERKIMNDGSIAEIIIYNTAIDIYVQFPQSKYCETSNIKHTTYHHFCKALVKNDFSPSIFNIACKGNERVLDKYGNRLTSYTIWNEMIRRCYKNYNTTQPTYEKVVVCDEWLCYSNFKKWFDKNYYTLEDDVVALDKDIMQYGNKLYSPETCIFVPSKINVLFRTKKQVKNEYLPIGISFNEKINKFIATHKGKPKHFDTFDEAFNYYKISKEEQIKNLAEQYKGRIPDKLYNRLINYEVQIEYPYYNID